MKKRMFRRWMMDNRTVDWTLPEGARWIDRAGLGAVTLADEWMRRHWNRLDTLKGRVSLRVHRGFRKGGFPKRSRMSAVLTAEVTPY
jgi:hypothetical protein